MLISTIILSFNSSSTLPRCLDHLIPVLESFDEQSEVFVVENGSKDNSKEVLAQYQLENPELIKPIYFDENTGTTFSRNAALKKAQGKYVLVLDSDAYVNEDAIKKLVAFLQNNPTAGMAVPRLTYASGNFQLSCDTFPTLWKKFQRFLFLKKMEVSDDDLSQSTKPTQVDYAISACWLLTQQCVKDTGLFDENIFYSPEDVDYCIRVWQSGHPIIYVPEAELIHDAQELSRGFKLNKFHFSHLKGLFYLFKKHNYFFNTVKLRQVKS